MSQVIKNSVGGGGAFVSSITGTAPIEANGVSGDAQTGPVTISITPATAGTSLTASLGAASFNSADFTVVNGFVTAIDTGTLISLQPTYQDDGVTSPGTPITGIAGNIVIQGLNPTTATVLDTINSNNSASGALEIETRAWLTPFVVDPSTTPGQRGTYSSIPSAITAAVAASYTGDIYIRTGTYVGNITLIPGIDLVAFTSDAYEPNVIIQGTCTLSAAGTVSITGIEFQTNSGFALVVSGSAASVLNLINCNINCLNNTGIDFTSSSANAQINLTTCQGNLGTTGIGLFTHSSAGTLTIDSSYFTNTGASTTASTCSSGVFNSSWSQFDFPLTMNSTSGTTWEHVSIYTSATNTLSATLNGSTHSCKWCLFSAGSASGISIGSANCIIDFSVVATTATNAITGTGTLKSGIIDFDSTSSGINTTTQIPKSFVVGAFQTQVPAGNYTVLNTDYFISASSSSTHTITLPSTPSTGEMHIIKDNTGTAGTNNITVSGNGNNIDGASTYVIANNFGSITVIFNSTQWNVI